MSEITKEMIEAAKAAYWHEAHNGGGYSDKCYEAAISAALSSRSAEAGKPVAGYRRRLPYSYEHYEFEQPGYENPSLAEWETLYAAPVADIEPVAVGDKAFFRDLAVRLQKIPVSMGVDGYDIDRLIDLARSHPGSAPSEPEAVRIANIEPVSVPDGLTDDERHIGVIRSAGGEHEDKRISVKQWSDEPERITFGIFMGNHRWFEVDFLPADAAKVAALILSKPAVKAAQAAAPHPTKTEAADADAVIERLTKALEPFASVSKLFDHLQDDNGSVLVNVRLGELRTARDALKSGRSQP